MEIFSADKTDKIYMAIYKPRSPISENVNILAAIFIFMNHRWYKCIFDPKKEQKYVVMAWNVS